MKTKRLIGLLALLAIFTIEGFSQGKLEKKTDTIIKQEKPTGDIITDQGLILTGRSEDIQQLKEYQDLFTESVKRGKPDYAEALQNNILRIFQNEILRSRNNVEQLKAGDTTELVKWQKENKPGKKVNVNIEIQTLTSRISYENSIIDLFKKVDVQQLQDDRNLTTVVGYINGFRNAMTRSLKYGSDGKNVPPPKPEKPKTGTGETGFIVEKGSKDDIKSDDPRINNWIESGKMRITKYGDDQAALIKNINAKDDKAIKKSYRGLIGLMQDEINSNNWMAGMIKSGTVDKEIINLESVEAKLEQQQNILNEAQSLNFSAPDDITKNKKKATELIMQFSKTFN